MATSMEPDVNFNVIPIDAFNYSLRLKLSNMLDPELPILERDKYARDYRGLAELMDFGNNAILNFQRNQNPTMAILNAWKGNNSVGKLLEILQKIQRYDVIDDLQHNINSSCESYMESRRIQPLQDPEVSTCIDNTFALDNPDLITIYDVADHLATFDAYVCYANSDVEFVRGLANKLEAPGTGIKLCIRERDLLCGNLEYDAFVRIIQERCRRILIILTPEFLTCPECEYQAKYAASLASEHRSRRLIPIVYKPCEIPPILKYISKVDFSRSDIQDWIWKKLIHSIKTPASELFVPASSSSNDLQTNFGPLTSEESSMSSFPVPALPDVPNDNISLDLPSTSSGTENLYPALRNMEKVALVESTVGSKSKGQKIVQRIRNFITSPSSSGSSGFHSQSDA